MKLAILFTVLAAAAHAEAPIAETATATLQSDGSWRFDVTVAHGDTGWDHFADAWVIEDQAGQILGERKLAHPHETEQPFTRSLSGVVIPDGTGQVYVRTHCNIDGWSEQLLEVTLK